MTTSIVTGGGGFIGSHVADALLKMGHRVVVLDDLSGGFIENMPSDADFALRGYGSITDASFINHVFDRTRPDYVFHLGAYAAEGLSHFIKTFNYTNNLLGSCVLINAAVNYGCKGFVFTSSMAVYGSADPPFVESITPRPEDSYGIAKWAVEQELRITHELFGLPHTIFRPHNCYSDDTEILTDDGFKLFADLLPNDSVATLNADGGIEYQKPTGHQKFKHEGVMIRFHSRRFDLLVTPDHPMIVRKRGSAWDRIEARTITDSHAGYLYRIKTAAASWKGKAEKYFTIPKVNDSRGHAMTNNHQNGHAKRIPMRLWCEFLGWYLSEGCSFKTDRNYVVSIVQYSAVHPEQYSRIVDIVRKMGFKPYLTGDKEIRIFSKQLYQAVKPFGNSRMKYVPKSIKELDQDNLAILFDALMSGDGDSTGKRYSSVSRQLAEDVYEICVKLGKTPYLRHELGENGGIYRVNISDTKEVCLGDMYKKKANYSREQYAGYVYDVTVPNHTIYVRRNGHGSWASNCYGPRQNIGDVYRNVIGIFMNQCMKNEPMTIFGDGTQLRAFSYIDDVAPIIAESVTNERAWGQTINIGADVPYTINELAEEVARAMDVPCRVEHLPARNEVQAAFSSHARLRHIFGKRETTPLREGLARMAEWAKQRGSQPTKPFTEIEIRKNLPPSWAKLG